MPSVGSFFQCIFSPNIFGKGQKTLILCLKFPLHSVFSGTPSNLDVQNFGAHAVSA